MEEQQQPPQPHPFAKLGVRADLNRGLEELGILNPTEVQQKAIPFLIQNGSDHDLVGQAQTGTGKTAAFGLPLLMKMDSRVRHVQGLVLAPTRELAKQIGKQLFRFTKHVEKKIFVEVLTGGDNIDRQAEALKRPTQIIVGTPGRIMDMIERRALDLQNVKHVVLDEADEMLSMGFKKQLLEILKLTGQRQSTWLFSATFPEAIHLLIRGCMEPNPHTIQVDQENVVNRDIDHRFVICKPEEKVGFISNFLKKQKDNRGLIFCRTKVDANTLTQALADQGFSVAVIQGDLMQKERDKVMRAFKKERVQVVVATDVAARGIDVAGLSFVIHHQLPEQLEYYTHRAGRTARAGNKGMSLALVHPKEKWKLPQIEKELHVTFRELRT
ncbi:MAG: DEAD/DEAH box helicase [Prosthecobacter sp.]